MMIGLYALLGFLVGAFLNLCADQLPRTRQLHWPPVCPYCNRPRPPWAWIGTLAYLRLKPECPYCAAPISWRHPLVELGTAALFAFVWQRYHTSALLIPYTLYSAILVLVLVIDLEQRLILNLVIYPAWAVALLASFFHPRLYFYRLALLGGVTGFGLLFLVYLGGELFVRVLSRRQGRVPDTVAFGFGDVRLGGFIGLILGFPDVLTALFLAVLLGGVAGLLYWFVQAVLFRRYSLFTAMPYGPYLVIGAMAVMFWGPGIVGR